MQAVIYAAALIVLAALAAVCVGVFGWLVGAIRCYRVTRLGTILVVGVRRWHFSWLIGTRTFRRPGGRRKGTA